MTPAKGNTNGDAPEGAFGKDKLYGNRIDQAFAIGERIWLMGGRIVDEVIETEFGPANPARLLVRKVDSSDNPTGVPFAVTTLASAIVDKVRALVDGELPALVELRKVPSRFRDDALVLQYVAGATADELAEEFGIPAASITGAATTDVPA